MPDLNDVPDILRRYDAAATEDFAARDEPVGELAKVVEQLARSELGKEEWAWVVASTDGVALESVSAGGPVIECRGKLWLLGGNGSSWSMPLQATFSLSEDRGSLIASEISMGDGAVES